MMKNVVIFPPLSLVRWYQIKCTLLLTGVPVFCMGVLAAVMVFLSQLNLYFLENGGLIVSQEIRQAYHDQVQMELLDVAWFAAVLVLLTFGVAYVVMGWAVSPFVNAEKVLNDALSDKKQPLVENDWLSESPAFHRAIWSLAKKVQDKSAPFDSIPEAKYRFTFAYFLKFVLVFYTISLLTSFVSNILLSTAYMKIVTLAISLVRMAQRGHYFMAQEQILRAAVPAMLVFSCVIYTVMGYYITRYMANMVFVFTRALREHHFPLRLRHSDIYHGLAESISDAARAAGLEKKEA